MDVPKATQSMDFGLQAENRATIFPAHLAWYSLYSHRRDLPRALQAGTLCPGLGGERMSGWQR